jgi:acyl dehydratase
VSSAAPVAVGDRFEREVTLDAASIAAFAAASGDPNPLHYDAEAAARSRFGGIIASGPQTASLLMGLCATWFTARGESVGLEFSFRFRKAVPAGARLTLRWTVVEIVPKPSLGGDLITVEGQALDRTGEAAVTSRGTALLMPAAAL